MKIWPNMEQRTEEWFRARAGRPTASQFSRLLTPTGKDSSQWDSYAIELCAQCIRPDEIGFEGNYHTDRGNDLEPEAREEFARIMGFNGLGKPSVEQVGFVTRDDEVIGCSPDSLIMFQGKPIAGLEIKCLLGKFHAQMLIDKAMDDKYKPQVHGSMAVCDIPWYFMSYCPGMASFITLVQPDAYTAKLSDALDRFLVFYSARRKEVMPMLLGKEAA